jgi:hypothetical protein
MRGLAAYLLAGILTVVAMDLISPPVGLGFALGALPRAITNVSTRHADQVSTQRVNRAQKGDRLNAANTKIGRRDVPPARVSPPPRLLNGCEPAFSPLSTSHGSNFARGCVA